MPSSASLADATGAMTAMPATRCCRWRLRASAIEARSRAPTLTTLTAKPASAASPANAASSEAGPNKVELCATTPSTLDRPVTRAFAAWFGR